MAAVLAATIISVAIPAFGADFYEAQLRLGAESYRAGRFTEAIDYLHIANFGFLEKSELLSEGLARLAMAESAAGRKDELDKTLSRFLAIERQIPAWSKAALSLEDRAAFEKLLLMSLPKESISSVPSLAHLGAPPPEEMRELTPDQRRKLLESKAKAEPGNPEWPLELARDANARGDTKAALKWCEKALKADAGAHEAHAMRLAIFTARKNDAASLRELSATPDSAWEAFPGIAADALVVFTRSRNYAQADAVVMRVTEADQSRADVAAAIAAARERSAKQSEAATESTEAPEVAPPTLSETPATTAPAATIPAAAAVAAPAPAPELPAATPVAGAGDVVDARTEASRGSFTGTQDRIGATLTSAKKLMSSGRPADAQRLLRDELVKTPGSRELRLAMLEASCLARDWRTGDAQISLVEPFRKGEDRYRFYAAVVLFETGKPEPAKTPMDRCPTRLAPSPFVDYYVKAVLGE